jgi:hypothetical protein
MARLLEVTTTTEDTMTIDERRKHLRAMKKRYVKAGQREKGRLLDEMEAVTGMHRKSLIRRMSSSLIAIHVAGDEERLMGHSSTMLCGSSTRAWTMSVPIVSRPIWFGWPSIWLLAVNWRPRLRCWNSWTRSASLRLSSPVGMVVAADILGQEHPTARDNSVPRATFTDREKRAQESILGSLT